MTLRTASLLALAAAGIAGCASASPADGGLDGARSTEALAAEVLADGAPVGDPRGLWVSEQQVTRADTFPDADSVAVVQWTQLWSSFEITDSTLVEEGVRRYQDYEPQAVAGGSLNDAVLDGETLTLILDTARVDLSLRVRGDSLFVTGPNGRTDGYRRAQSSAPPPAVGTWRPEVPGADVPPQLIVSADGFLAFGPDDPAGAATVLGPFFAWEVSQLTVPPEVPGEYWDYETVLPYALDGDRMTVTFPGSEPVTFLRADP